MNENDIIIGCLKNDRASQKALYDLFYTRMLGVCLRYSNNSDEAKEIVHEGFLSVFENLKNFKDSSSFESWIRRIMALTAIEHLRKNKHYLIVSTVNANDKKTIVIPEKSDDEIAAQIDKDDVLKAVQELTPAYRTVYNMFTIEEYTHKEIAEILDISEDTSKSNLSKARYNLRKNLLSHLKLAANGN